MEKFAKITLPIALDKEFDYSFPATTDLRPGMRALVNFRGKERVGLVTALADSSKLKKIKTISRKLDRIPLLKSGHFTLAKKMGELYPYALGEFLFMMIPAYLKSPRELDPALKPPVKQPSEVVIKKFIKAETIGERYRLWRGLVEDKLKYGSVMICFPQGTYLQSARQLLENDFPGRAVILHSQKSDKENFLNWRMSREKSLILGTRMSLFYYPEDLQLIIVEEADSPYYYQEEKPFYNLVDVAGLLSEVKKVNLILAGNYPSLDTYKKIKDKTFALEEAASLNKKINIVDLSGSSRKKIVGPVLTELLSQVLRINQAAVVLWNKRGFSQVVSCSACGQMPACSHCSGFLQLTAVKNIGRCPYCNRQVTLPEICPSCRKGYLKPSRLGIDGVGALLKTVFPEVKIDNWDRRSAGSKVILATAEILSDLYNQEYFYRGFLLDTDSLLSRATYQATFDTFIYIKKLAYFFTQSLTIFTRNRQYYLFDYLNKPWPEFYEQELSLRNKMGLPPFKLLAKITLRSKNENLLLKQSQGLYNKLKVQFTDVYGPHPAQPFKLRDKFRYLITVKSKNTLKQRRLIKMIVSDLRSSGIQMAVELE